MHVCMQTHASMHEHISAGISTKEACLSYLLVMDIVILMS